MLNGRCEPLGSRSAGCRRSFSDEPPYRSQISFLFKSKGAESTGSVSNGPNPLLEDSFFCRRPFCARALLALAAPRPASEESHTESPTTAKRALPTLSVAPESRSVMVMQLPPRLKHADARVGYPDVEKWPTCWARTPAAGLGTRGGHQGLVGSKSETRLSLNPYGS